MPLFHGTVGENYTFLAEKLGFSHVRVSLAEHVEVWQRMERLQDECSARCRVEMEGICSGARLIGDRHWAKGCGNFSGGSSRALIFSIEMTFGSRRSFQASWREPTSIA